MASGYHHNKSSSEKLRKRKKSKIPTVLAKKEDTTHKSHVVQRSVTRTVGPLYFFQSRWLVFALLAVVPVTFMMASILRMMVLRPILVIPPITNHANNPPQAVDDNDSSPSSNPAVKNEENDNDTDDDDDDDDVSESEDESKQNIQNSGDYIVLEVLPHDTTSFT
jgi:hypothetical protein